MKISKNQITMMILLAIVWGVGLYRHSHHIQGEPHEGVDPGRPLHRRNEYLAVAGSI
jgi:hypothetical protein